MPPFRFYHPIEIRYGDLDPQGHVNNAKCLTYLEQARIAYVLHLGLWDGRNFFDIGFILADVHVTYRAPILFGQSIRVGVRISRLGNKSMTMEYCLEDIPSGKELVTGSTVLVAYDYRDEMTMPIPESWRKAIREFEGISLNHEA